MFINHFAIGKLVKINYFMKIDSLDKVIPIDTLPIEKYNGNKWNFISDYWANNFSKFKK